MNKKLGILFVVLAVLTACNKDYPKMKVIRDCTGTYLRSDKGYDFYVCNHEALDTYDNGKEIRVKTESVSACYGLLDEISCTDVHIYESKLEVVDIKD